MSTSTKRKGNLFDPLNASDKPDAVLRKLKVISEFASDMTSKNLDKENTKSILALLDNLTQNFIDDSVSDHPQLMLMLSCCLVDLIRILGTSNPQIVKKTNNIVSMVNETLQNSNKLTDQAYLPQLFYLLESLDKAQISVALVTEKNVDLTKSFIEASLEAVDHLQNQPEIYAKFERLLGSLFDHASHQRLKDNQFQEFLLPLLFTFNSKDNKKSKKFELSKSLIKNLSFQLKQNCSAIIEDIFQKKGVYKNIQPALTVDEICYIIQTLFKIDSEMSRKVWDLLQTEISNLGRKESKRNYLILIGKICASKKSHVSTTYPKIFEYFMDSLTYSPYKPFRKDLLELAFKYIKNFTYCKTVSEFEIATSTVKYDVYKQNLAQLESKIKDLLYEKEDGGKYISTKSFILEKIKALGLEGPQFISQDLLKLVASLLWNDKENKKGSILEVLGDLYIHYCCTLYEEDLYDFDHTERNFEVVDGRVSSFNARRKETAKNFLWIGEILIIFFYNNSKKSFWTLQTVINKILGLQTLQSKIIVRRLLGFFYNLWTRKYQEIPKDPKSISYPEFVNKKLKYNWFSDADITSPTFNFIFKGVLKIFKVTNRLHLNFARYMRALGAKDEQKAEEAKSFILTYYAFTRNFKEIEKDFAHYLTKTDFVQNLNVALDPKQSFIKKQQILTKLTQVSEVSECKAIIQNLAINPFNEEISSRLCQLVSDILQKDRHYPIFLKDVALKLSISLVKMNISDDFKRSQEPIASYLLENLPNLLFPSVTTVKENPTPTQTQAGIDFKTSCLQFLSLMDLQDLAATNNTDVESIKYYLEQPLVKAELYNKQAKFAARIIRSLDNVTSEVISIRITEKLLSQLEIKNPALQSILRAISELLKGNIQTFIRYMDTFTRFLTGLISEPVALPRESLVAELTQCKKVLIKLLYTHFFLVGHPVVNEAFQNQARAFKKTLLTLLLNFNDVCAGFMRADKDYLRIHVLDYYIEIVSQQNSVELDLESYAKLSLLCYDDNDDLKKFLYSSIAYKRNRKGNPLNYLYLLYGFFLSFAEDENLRNMASHNFQSEVETSSQAYDAHFRKTNAEDITKSSEYLLVYIIFLMSNNPLILLKAKSLPLHFYKCLDFFLTSLNNKFRNPHKELYLFAILNELKRYEPVVFHECADTTIEFTDLKKKKIVAKKPKKGDNSEAQKNEDLTFLEIIDAIKKHFDGKLRLPDNADRKIHVPIPLKLFKFIEKDQHPTTGKKDLRMASLKASVEQAEVLHISPYHGNMEEELNHSSYSSVSQASDELVKKLDFTQEEVKKGFLDIDPPEFLVKESRSRSSEKKNKREGSRRSSKSNRKASAGGSRRSSKSNRKASTGGSRRSSKSNRKASAGSSKRGSSRSGSRGRKGKKSEEKGEIMEIVYTKEEPKRSNRGASTKSTKQAQKSVPARSVSSKGNKSKEATDNKSQKSATGSAKGRVFRTLKPPAAKPAVETRRQKAKEPEPVPAPAPRGRQAAKSTKQVPTPVSETRQKGRQASKSATEKSVPPSREKAKSQAPPQPQKGAQKTAAAPKGKATVTMTTTTITTTTRVTRNKAQLTRKAEKELPQENKKAKKTRS